MDTATRRYNHFHSYESSPTIIDLISDNLIDFLNNNH